MAKKPAVTEPDIETDLDAGVPQEAEAQTEQQIADDVLRSYNISEIMWLASRDPGVYQRWVDLTTAPAIVSARPATHYVIPRSKVEG